MKIHSLLLLMLLLLGILCARRHKDDLADQVQKVQERNTVIQANHYYSKQQKSTTINMATLEVDKSLVFFLKPPNNNPNDQTISTNPITITLDVQPNSVTCNFTSYTSLCSVPRVTDKSLNLKIQCKQLPCQLTWQIVQPPVKQDQGDHKINQLVSVNANKDHAVLTVTCQNPQIKDTFGQSLRLYSNSLNKQFNTKQGSTYFLFSNEQKGYYYLTSQDQKTLACAQPRLKQIQDIVQFNNPNFTQYDFVSSHDPSSYEFKTIPTTDFRIQFAAGDIQFLQLSNQTGIQLKLTGFKGSTQTVLSKFFLGVDDQKNNLDFSVVYKKPTENFDRMQISMLGQGRPLLVQTAYFATQIQDVQFGQQSYFDLKKGDIIKYRLVPLSPQIKNIKTMKIFVQGDQFKSTKSQCSQSGCQFQVQATADGRGRIYIGQNQQKQSKQIIVQEFKDTVTKKVREGDQIYYSYKMQDTSALQLLVNTPNVIVYAASAKKCPTIDEVKCYQNVFNSHNPSIYEPKQVGTLQFKVIALQSSQFTLRILKESDTAVLLSDTVPFTYLMDDKQSKIAFIFNNPSKSDVSFNLIAPLNEVNLIVVNSKTLQKKDEKNQQISSDGYIHYTKKQIKQQSFTIIVQKNSKYLNKYVHFTLIASTKQSNLRLQSGLAHYQTIPPKGSVDYVCLYQQSKKIQLNIYTHNFKDDLKIQVKVSNTDDYKNQNTTAQFTINKQVDYIHLQRAAKMLCEQSKRQSCQLFIRVYNKIDVQIDVTITLMVEDAVIQLKDGLWQSYGLSLLSATAHFYFQPTHQNHSTTILYKSSAVDIKIMYTLWQNDDTSINPAKWPFPNQFKQNQKLSQLTFKPLQFVHIQPQDMKACWPNCLVLLSIAPDFDRLTQKQKMDQIKQYYNKQDLDFKIMASNNYIQLPQKQLVDVPLMKGQDKEILVDLKYVMDKDQLTFNHYNSLGSVQLSANVYSQKIPKCPTEKQSDFDFFGKTTTLTLKDITAKLQQNEMQDHKNIYLCILAHAQSDAKFSIQFSSDQDGFKKLQVDTRIALDQKRLKAQNLYYMDISSQFYFKITRNQGFPYFSTKICKGDVQLSKCMDKFSSSHEQGVQLADKVTSLDQVACDSCTLLIKLSADDPYNVDIHPQSKYGQIQLVQNHPISDSLTVDEKNSYLITGNQNEQIVINIQIISGNIKVQLHDFQKIDITKTNKQGSKNINIIIPPSDLKAQAKKLGMTHMTAFAMSSFVHLHCTIQSQNHQQAAAYTLSYSSGDSIMYLQDGLITQYNLIPKKATKFIYTNPVNTSVYLHISTPDINSLNKLSIQMFAMTNPQDQNDLISMQPQRPQFNKKTPNPTLLMLLPAKKRYMITVTSKNQKDTIFTIGINNRQVIFLPFDHDFPVQIDKNQTVYLVLQTSNPGYLRVTISKCDQSSPQLGYTYDYDQFVNQDFDTIHSITQELNYDLFLKIKEKQQSVYIRLYSPNDISLLTIKAVYSTQKFNVIKPKPGDNGVIKYQLLDSTKAQMTFTSLVCANDNKNCNKQYTYSAISSSQFNIVMSQLVCSTVAFDLPRIQQLKAANIHSISSNGGRDNKITFTQQLKGDVSYVGVKAISTKTGQVVYYRPVQIVTLWGQMSRSRTSTIIIAAIIIVICVIGTLLVLNRYRKKMQDYKPLDGELDGRIDRQ